MHTAQLGHSWGTVGTWTLDRISVGVQLEHSPGKRYSWGSDGIRPVL